MSAAIELRARLASEYLDASVAELRELLAVRAPFVAGSLVETATAVIDQAVAYAAVARATFIASAGECPCVRFEHVVTLYRIAETLWPPRRAPLAAGGAA